MLKNEFKFKLSEELINYGRKILHPTDYYTDTEDLVFTAKLDNGTYMVYWKADEQEKEYADKNGITCIDYTISRVENCINNGDWIIVE